MKKIISLFIIFCIALSACASAPEVTETTAQPTAQPTSPAPTVDDISLNNILYLFADMTDIGLDSYMRSEVSPEDAGWKMGYEDFAGEFEAAMALEPMMNIDPFVLIVFRLAEGADAAAFAADIETNANPGKWVCVQADSVFTRVSGRTVLFVMCASDMVQPISDCFAEMSAEGFDPEAHLVNPLAGKTPQDVYDELYQLFSVEEYGFMDNESLSQVDADAAYGLSNLDFAKIEASILDDGYAEADDEDAERAYVLAILQVKDGESEEEIAADIQSVLDVSGLLGGEASCLTAYGSGFVILYAGTGSYAISATALENYLPITYRLTAAAF